MWSLPSSGSAAPLLSGGWWGGNRGLGRAELRSSELPRLFSYRLGRAGRRTEAVARLVAECVLLSSSPLQNLNGLSQVDPLSYSTEPAEPPVSSVITL